MYKEKERIVHFLQLQLQYTKSSNAGITILFFMHDMFASVVIVHFLNIKQYSQEFCTQLQLKNSLGCWENTFLFIWKLSSDSVTTIGIHLIHQEVFKSKDIAKHRKHCRRVCS